METEKSTKNIDPAGPSILVVGTGAIGSFYGGKLAQAGARVSVVCRSDYETIKAHGIRVASPLGDFHFQPEKILHEASEYGAVPDYILVGMKVLPEVNTAEIIRGAVGPETAIVLIQNGVEIEEPVALAFPHNEIVSGLAYIAVSRTAPGEILHQQYGRLTLGLYPSGDSAKVQRLACLLPASGIPCEVTSEVVSARWQKLVWNAPFNPISVLGGAVDTRVILSSEESVDLVRKVMEEVCLAAKAAGHELPPSVVQQNIDGTKAMKPYKPSMLLDYEGKRPMEVEAILGNAVRAARRLSVPVPHLETLYALLQLVDEGNRSRVSEAPCHHPD